MKFENHGLFYATHSLTNHISKWRLRDRRGQTAPAIEAAEAVATSSEAAAVNNQEPLLSRLAGTGKAKLKRIRFRSNRVTRITTYRTKEKIINVCICNDSSINIYVLDLICPRGKGPAVNVQCFRRLGGRCLEIGACQSVAFV